VGGKSFKIGVKLPHKVAKTKISCSLWLQSFLEIFPISSFLQSRAKEREFYNLNKYQQSRSLKLTIQFRTLFNRQP
jgi:hypothetical protein